MSYLIFKIGAYLLVAMACGAGAGWLARNVSAVRQEDDQQRQLAELGAKLPQLETLMRTRDDQLTSLRAQLKEKDQRIGRLHDEVGALGKMLESAEHELEQAKTAKDAAAPVEEPSAESQRIAELAAEVGRLHSQLSDARVRAAAPQRADADEGERLREELQSLEERLKQNGQEHDRMSQVLEQERRKVVELERERELQSKSLQLLHQQLELERERAG